MRVARFKIFAPLDMASRPSQGTVVIEGDGNEWVVSVRPFRRRRVYVSTLAAIARDVVRQTIAQEVREKKAARRARRQPAKRGARR